MIGPGRVRDRGNEPTFARVLRLSRSKGAARLVLLAIANHCRKNGAGAYPKIETIAREAGMSVRNVQRQIPRLVASGELIATERRNNTYLFAVDLKECDHDTRGGEPHPERGDDFITRGLTDVSPAGDGPVTREVTPSSYKPSKEPPLEPDREPPVPLAALPSDILEGIDGILAIRGNRLRGRNKRYRCNMTREQITKIVDKALEEMPPKLVAEALEAFRFYTPHEGFTSANAFAQKMALLKWIRKQKPPLMEAVEELLARVGSRRSQELIREARNGQRATLEYITTEELRELHRQLQTEVSSAPHHRGFAFQSPSPSGLRT